MVTLGAWIIQDEVTMASIVLSYTFDALVVY